MGQWSELEFGHVVVATPSHKASRGGLVYKSEMAPPPRPNPARRKQTAGTTEREIQEGEEKERKLKGVVLLPLAKDAFVNYSASCVHLNAQDCRCA